MSERLFQFGTAQPSFWPGLDGNFDSGTDLERIWNGFGTDLEQIWNGFGTDLERLCFRSRTFHLPNQMHNYDNVF